MYDSSYSIFHDHLVTNITVSLQNAAGSDVLIKPDVHFLMLCTAFAIPYLAFLFVLPGIRKHRLASFLTLTITFIVGFISLGAILHPAWNTGSTRILSQFHSHSTKRVKALVGAHVGLYSLNITMNQIASMEPSEAHFEGVHFNERFDISSVGSMGKELQLAYRRGLPYPMLKLLEYFSLNEGAFDWGRKYRLAGHYAGAALWMGFAIWILQVIILCAAPHNYSKVAIFSGVFMLIGVLLYVLLCPRQLRILFMGVDGSVAVLEMHYGICFYATLIIGLLNLVFGALLCILQYTKRYSLSTFLDASIDEHVPPTCSSNSYAKRALKEAGDLTSVTFISTMKTLSFSDCDLRPNPCSNTDLDEFDSSYSSPFSLSGLNSSMDEFNAFNAVRSKSSIGSIETLSQCDDIIVDRF